jgi:zinc-ribbon domain
MLVCPECRNENPEEAKFCTWCGRSLAAAETALRRFKRREDSDEGIEIAIPKLPNPLFSILGVVVAALIAVGVGAWYLTRPNPCEGKQASDQFPYCLELPSGWDQATEDLEGQQADTYSPPSGDALILVQAEQVQPGMDTQAYAEAHRDRQEAGGLFPGPLEHADVGGLEAISWEVTTTTEAGTALHQLQVALVRAGTGWVINYVGNEESYPRDRDLFQQVLETWSFQ